MFRMSPYPSPAYGSEPDAEEPAAAVEAAPCAPAWAEEHLEVLRDIRDMGMTLARTLTRQVVRQAEADEALAEAGEGVSEPPRRVAAIDPALSFSRISRAVRLTLALEARTHQAIEDRARRGLVANDDGSDNGGSDGPIDYEGIKRKLAPKIHAIIHGECDYQARRVVEETIEAACDDLDDVDRLKEELKERLEEDEVFADRGTWPIGETISLICQDLGLTPDWDRWENQGWARKEAAESPLNSPYATVVRPTRPGYYPQSGTAQYREARGLPPLEGPVLRPARGPPSDSS
jgi:hypothetical protein